MQGLTREKSGYCPIHSASWSNPAPKLRARVIRSEPKLYSTEDVLFNLVFVSKICSALSILENKLRVYVGPNS